MAPTTGFRTLLGTGLLLAAGIAWTVSAGEGEERKPRTDEPVAEEGPVASLPVPPAGPATTGRASDPASTAGFLGGTFAIQGRGDPVVQQRQQVERRLKRLIQRLG